MFSGPSTYAEAVDSTMLFIMAISFFFLIGITVTMIYFVFRYSRKRNPKAKQIEGHLGLEITWIVIPIILVMGMFYYSYSDFYQMRDRTDIDMNISVTARMWNWQFEYENGKITDTLYIPNNTVTRLNMTSLDVIHSMFIPAFRIKEDVINNKETYIILEPKQEGSYNIACAEYCGLNHSYMYTKLVVMPKDEFDKWIVENDTALVELSEIINTKIEEKENEQD